MAFSCCRDPDGFRLARILAVKEEGIVLQWLRRFSQDNLYRPDTKAHLSRYEICQLNVELEPLPGSYNGYVLRSNVPNPFGYDA